MDLVFLIVMFVVVPVAAVRAGYDSRERHRTNEQRPPLPDSNWADFQPGALGLAGDRVRQRLAEAEARRRFR